MKTIDKNNITEFMTYYNGLHDSNITNINYDITNSKVEISINVFWSGEPTLKEDNTYETNKTKIKLELKEIEEFKCKTIDSFEDIRNAYLNYINLNNKELICFANDEKNPTLYVVCEEITYEEIK